jgi:hypothetical protein
MNYLEKEIELLSQEIDAQITRSSGCSPQQAEVLRRFWRAAEICWLLIIAFGFIYAATLFFR